MSANIPLQLQTVFKYVDSHKTAYIETLKEAVAFQSVSIDPNKREECIKIMRWTEKCFRKVGAETELCDIGKEEIPGGKTIKRLPVLIALFGKKSGNKKTVCIYGHMDVVSAKKEDGWITDPFILTEKDGKLFGRGASDNKGPILCWLHAIEAFQANKIELPVNVKFIVECMEEVGSVGLENFMLSKKKTFFNDVDYLCISDSSWLYPKKPSISYGTRGIVYFSVEVEGPKRDLHSGTYGGLVQEPMSDLIFLLNSLQDHNGKIQVPGLHDFVVSVTPEEERLYEDIALDIEELRNHCGVYRLAHKEDKVRLLMHNWRFPSLSYHGIEGAYSGSGGKTVIPAKVSGKVSLRLVQHQTPERITEKVQEYLQQVFKLRKSSNVLRVQLLASSKTWSENPLTPHYQVFGGTPGKSFRYTGVNLPRPPQALRAAIPQLLGTDLRRRRSSLAGLGFQAAMRAVKYVYKAEPDLTREGRSIPVCNMLKDVTDGKSLLLLPICKTDDCQHTSNEKIDLKSYIDGIKVMAGYIYEVSLL
ncbi:cytosolic non-specific dipeptidase-like [Periplaneta americana]|uniref:cytosolic non-specific dipeptidase-like n=1 Tax=Periplaneta americana TaxID=6978 RepID=UPI0037E87613